MRGITITNYLSGGDPKGIIFSYLSNWSGQAIKIPRNLFSEAKLMPELQRPGLYLLFGQDIENPEDKKVYIGEANVLFDRISQHLRDADKAFAETIICFSSKDEILTVSHTKYLEQKVIGHALNNNEYTVINRKEGNRINLSKMVQDEMDAYYENMQIILPTLGYPLLHQTQITNKENSILEQKYFLNIKKIKAEAKLTSNGIEVQPGSKMSEVIQPSLAGSYESLRNSLFEKGVIIKQSSEYVFEQAYEFKSPSTAASALLGYSINGRTAWKNKQGKSLKEMEEENS